MNKKIMKMPFLIVAVNGLVKMFDFIFGWVTTSSGCFMWLFSVCPGKCYESILKSVMCASTHILLSLPSSTVPYLTQQYVICAGSTVNVKATSKSTLLVSRAL
jgi:hypothetical protein